MRNISTVPAIMLTILTMVSTSLNRPALQASTVSDEFTIVPGQSIGPIKLGMHIADTLAILGHYSSKSGEPLPQYTWATQGGRLLVSTYGNPESVTAVSIMLDYRYVTSTGLHVGDASGRVKELIGVPASIHPGLYDIDIWYYSGIAFAIGRSNIRQCADHVCGIGVGKGFGEVF